MSATIDVGDGTITITHTGLNAERRPAYAYTIKTPSWTFEGNDIAGGVGAQPDEEGMQETLASFLAAAGEARPGSENEDLFPQHVKEWADQHSDELAMLSTRSDWD